jgi:hypothetical protein
MARPLVRHTVRVPTTKMTARQWRLVDRWAFAIGISSGILGIVLAITHGPWPLPAIVCGLMGALRWYATHAREAIEDGWLVVSEPAEPTTEGRGSD